MRPAHFVDSWFFIANIDRSDSHHQNARRLRSALRETPLVTHDAVLTEVLAFFAAQGEALRREAVRAVRSAVDALFVLTPDRGLFLRALALYERRLDKEYSLVDCMSMIVMEDHAIRHVLTNDHHFEQAGFTLVTA